MPDRSITHSRVPQLACQIPLQPDEDTKFIVCTMKTSPTSSFFGFLDWRLCDGGMPGSTAAASGRCDASASRCDTTDFQTANCDGFLLFLH